MRFRNAIRWASENMKQCRCSSTTLKRSSINTMQTFTGVWLAWNHSSNTLYSHYWYCTVIEKIRRLDFPDVLSGHLQLFYSCQRQRKTVNVLSRLYFAKALQGCLYRACLTRLKLMQFSKFFNKCLSAGFYYRLSIPPSIPIVLGAAYVSIVEPRGKQFPNG